jgi:hypothetical protein
MIEAPSRFYINLQTADSVAIALSLTLARSYSPGAPIVTTNNN